MTDSPEVPLTGTLHIFVAFDWGEEIDLEHARRLAPAEFQVLPRRPRTPASIAYKPPPLRFTLGPPTLDLPEVGTVQPAAEATVFDFATVGVALRVPFRLPAAGLGRLAGRLAEPTAVVLAARTAVLPLFKELQPALKSPLWKEDFSEEYFVFHMAPGQGDGHHTAPPRPLAPAYLLEGHAAWLGGLLRLDAGPLSGDEVAEALRLSLRYSPNDLFLPDWGAAVLLDSDCDETLQIVELTNLQLLSYRQIDDRLDDNLQTAYRLNHDLTRSWLPFWRTYTQPIRELGELKVEANDLFERTGNVLKLAGDQYLARVYRLLAERFHLKTWESSIQRKLEVIEGVYQVLSDQAATYRAELLEVIIVVLILFEIVMAFFRQ